ncbi:hypothetical protein NUW54_g8366 [Trametes sanguinea]|uniref:Uncharacterized protein n=1 Tax=Trametes sanguinea TaxID=158606 RepID=A0ACC1PFB5_9APHY|nr:hypothetical protein NUW54_g8366 [Trametes sanguinea]
MSREHILRDLPRPRHHLLRGPGRRHSNRSSNPGGIPSPSASKNIWTSPLFLATAMLLMTVTAHWVLTVRRLFEAFIYDDGGQQPTKYFLTVEANTQVAATAFVVSSVIVGDIILTYRIWVVWDRRWSFIIFPSLCTLGYVAMGFSVVQLFAAYVPGESIFVNAAQRRIITTAALTLSTNIYGTVSIAYRIWKSNRAMKQEVAMPKKGLPEALVIFIESAALYTTWTLFFLVSYSSNSLLEAFAFHCIPAATGISFTLIILSVVSDPDRLFSAPLSLVSHAHTRHRLPPPRLDDSRRNAMSNRTRTVLVRPASVSASNVLVSENNSVTELREKIKTFLASQGMIKGHSGSGPRSTEQDPQVLILVAASKRRPPWAR